MKVCTKNPLHDIQKWRKRFNRRLEHDEASINTKKAYGRVLDAFERYIKNAEIESIKQIDSDFILDFVEWREEEWKRRSGKGYAARTRHFIIVVLKNFFSFIELNAEYESDGTRFSWEWEFRKLTGRLGKKVRKKTGEFKYLTGDEIINLIEKLDWYIEEKGRRKDYLYAFAVKMMLYGGLRVSEVVRLRKEDIYVKEGQNGEKIAEITLRNTKSQTEQVVPIRYRHIQKELSYLIEHQTGEVLVSSRKGKPLDRSFLYRLFKRIYKDAGIQKRGLHMLRHTAAMRLLRKAGDITLVQDFLRHSDIKTTMVYLHKDKSRLEKAID